MHHIQSRLFVDSQLQHPIDDLSLSFTDYIARCKVLISQHRCDLNTADAEKIITANAPFELRPQKPAQCGALLIHGLFDSPLMMRDIGLQLQAQGILTRAILLPGHGTVPGDLLHVDYHQWLQAVRYGIATFSKEVKTLFLIGFSTGASLALYHTLQNTHGIAGVILLSPALKINSVFASLANMHQAFSRVWPRAAWFHQDKNEMLDYAKYYSIPFNAVYQVYKLTQAIKKEKPATLPLLFALSQNDNTVCSNASLDYFHHQLHAKNHLLLYSNDATFATDPRITQRHTSYPLLRIRDFSHLSLPISPRNPHYGEEGDYRFASHIKTDDQTIYGEFSPSQIYFNEWLFKLKLSSHHYQRLTFNPDFDFLMRRMKQFIVERSIVFI
jgi:esterase/lipase